MLVLCESCGMQVLTLPDGSCPSCGVRGTLSVRRWRGEPILTLILTSAGAAGTAPRYACLYLRPFTTRFRAAARMRAVGRAMQPFGITVALHAGEARSLRRVKMRERENTVGTVLLSTWNQLATLIEWLLGEVFAWEGVELFDTTEDRWRAKFRELALQSRVIVMDVSAPNDGLDYEAEFITDFQLAGRLILLHNAARGGHRKTEEHVDRLRSVRSGIPVVSYTTWGLRQLTRDLRAILRAGENVVR